MSAGMMVAFGFLLGIVAIGFFLYIIRETKKFTITSYTYQNEKVPKEFDGCKIAFITDLHNYSYGKNNCQLIQAIEEKEPDYILVGGDMIVKGPNFDPSVALHLLEQLSKRYPIYYANGNHELRISNLPETKDTTYVEYVKTLHSYGITHLVNQRARIIRGGSSIEVVGLNIPERYFEKFSKKTLPVDAIKKLVASPNGQELSILLAHNPIYFEEYASWGADLVLSGHVHGGLVALPFIGGVISTQGLLFPKYDFGEFHYENSTMFLSRGAGNHTVNIRVNNRAEIVMLTLKTKKM